MPYTIFGTDCVIQFFGVHDLLHAEKLSIAYILTRLFPLLHFPPIPTRHPLTHAICHRNACVCSGGQHQQHGGGLDGSGHWPRLPEALPGKHMQAGQLICSSYPTKVLPAVHQRSILCLHLGGNQLHLLTVERSCPSEHCNSSERVASCTVCNLQDAMADAKTVVWNGPMGVFEIPAFAKGTLVS